MATAHNNNNSIKQQPGINTMSMKNLVIGSGF